MSEERLAYLEGIIPHFEQRIVAVEEQLKEVSSLYAKILDRRNTKEWLEELIVWAQEQQEKCQPEDRENMCKFIAARKRDLAELEGKDE